MESISQTMDKAKRARLNPIRKWTLEEEKMLLEFLGENRDFEKPTAQLFYKRFLDEKIINVNWKLVRAKVRNMRTNYNKTKSWENSTGAGSMDGATLKSTLLRKCPYYFEFDDIFGGRFNSSTVSEEGLDTPGDDYMERDSQPTPPESSVEGMSQPQATTSRKGIYSRTGVSDIMTTHNALIKLRTDQMAQESAARDREIILKEKELELKKREVDIKEMEVLSRENIERERLKMEERLAMAELRMKYNTE